MTLRSPHLDVCQECATWHDPPEPHDRESWCYQLAFRHQHGRCPTWADAIAHCPPIIKKALQDALHDRGLFEK